MENRLAKTLDECIRRVHEGEPIEECLARYPGMREELAPLLFTALDISAGPRVTASGKFRKESRSRLVTLLRQEAARKARNRSGETPQILKIIIAVPDNPAIT